jgi:hypothetical protein
MAYSGLDVDVVLDASLMVTFDKVTLKIDDASKEAMSKGRPNGSLRGAVSAGGDITLQTAELKKILDLAKRSGSFQQLAPFDMVINADNVDDGSFKVEAFGCKFKLADLIDADANGEGQLMHTINFFVTGKEFVNINGVPYLRTSDIEKLK